MTLSEIKHKIRSGEMSKREFHQLITGFLDELDRVIADGTRSLSEHAEGHKGEMIVAESSIVILYGDMVSFATNGQPKVCTVLGYKGTTQKLLAYVHGLLQEDEEQEG